MIDRRLIYVIFIIAGVLAVYYLFTCQPRKDDPVLDRIADKQQVIDEMDKRIKLYEEIKTDLKQLLQQSYHRDSTLMQSFQRNQPVYIKYDNQLKNIPVNIANLRNDDDIRAGYDRHK